MSDKKTVFFRLLIVGLFMMSSGVGYAATKTTEREPSVSSWTSNHLNKVNELLAKEAYIKARAKLDALMASVEKDHYEAGLVNQAIAYSYAMQDNYPDAIVYFEKALPGLAASFAQTQKTRFDLGQLYMAEEQFEKARDVLLLWLTHSDKKSAQVHILLGNAYAQLEQPRKAIPHVSKAIDIYANKKDDPNESWYKLLLALYLETENYQASATLLPTMIGYFSADPLYWKQLGSVYTYLKQYPKASAAFDIAWQQGALNKESELVRLAHLFIHTQVPEKAARLLDKEIANGNISASQKRWLLLSDAWMLSRELDKAAIALTKAANLSENGDLYERIAGIYIELEQWKNAKSALVKGIEKGNLKNPGNAFLLLGITELELDSKSAAKKAFLKAKNFENTEGKARQWIQSLG